MRPIVLGTAGHIDHGKTALVRAITGIDCDRLPEEKARGITLDLGFAHLPLPGGVTAGVVDVPGHERLVRRMVAGATGIDAVLLVVAADEGVMPQTREHLHICRFLEIPRGIVALTKCDLVDSEIAEAAEAEIRELLRGTVLEGASLVRVSSQTGQGLDTLRAEIARLAVAASEPPRAASAAPRLAIDRVFTMKGFGTVVTGTLAAGRLRTGEEVVLLPPRLPAKIRGLQSYHQPVQEAGAGSRVAVNLQGIDRAAIERGFVLSHPGRLEPTERLDAGIALLAEARPLRTRARVRFHAGTRETQGHLLLLDREALSPGDRAYAQIVLDEPVVILPGDRFIVRGFSWLPGLGQTVGGGRVLDAHPPPHPSFRASPKIRRRLEGVVEELKTFAGGDPRETLHLRIRRAGAGGLGRRLLAAQVPFDEAAVDHALGDLEKRGAVAASAGDRRGEAVLISREALDALVARIAARVDAHHAAHPMEPGISREALRSQLAQGGGDVELAPAVFRRALEEAEGTGRVRCESERVRSASHRVTVGEADRATMDTVERALRDADLEPPTFRDLTALIGAPAPRVRTALSLLRGEGRAVRVKEDLFFHRDALERLAKRLRAFLAERGEITPGEYKTLTSTTRKYTVPLMEHFDSEKLTIRTGEVRKLRRRD
jgi:selenocysteine-specific elongation factor